MDTFISEHLFTALFFGIAACVACFIAYRCKYFQLKAPPEEPIVSLRHVILMFIIYFGTIFLITPFMLMRFGTSSLVVKSVVILFFSFLVVISLGFLFFQFQPKILFQKIWKNSNSSFLFDVLLGLLTCLIAFPVMVTINALLEAFVYVVFHVMPVDQNVVAFLKMIMDKPRLLIFACIGIILLAPIIEEFLFRGFLQTYLRGLFGSKAAFVITAICFTLIHYSLSQGLSNIPILASLFSLGLFLGFIYERQRSLITPIVLHMTFNSISVITILFKINA